jgi:hypothetical protein
VRICFAADAESVKDVDDLANFAVDAFEEIRNAFPDAEYRAAEPEKVHQTPKPADV